MTTNEKLRKILNRFEQTFDEKQIFLDEHTDEAITAIKELYKEKEEWSKHVANNIENYLTGMAKDYVGREEYIDKINDIIRVNMCIIDALNLDRETNYITKEDSDKKTKEAFELGYEKGCDNHYALSKLYTKEEAFNTAILAIIGEDWREDIKLYADDENNYELLREAFDIVINVKEREK